MKFFRRQPRADQRHLASPEGPFWAAYSRLVDEGLIDDRASRGLPESALEEIATDQGVRLDPEYADFLRCMGAGSGNTLASQVVFYPAILGIRESAVSLCNEVGISCDLAGAIFVASHQGYIYFYVDTRQEGTVWCLTEDSPAPVRVADSFSDFFYDYVKSA
ncbi:SMI1/KNR4 family protein [Streptomyces sp. NBC_00443]|uniref:SMI1/KNR4 family protein n=1 Tax=Streptomyces sp. NBC_00443 TaxID=2975743 RepID=UPI002E22EBAE